MTKVTRVCESSPLFTVETVMVLGVKYTHLKLDNQDDFYVTKFGLPFLEQLRPEGWFWDRTWFRNNAVRLVGSSVIYKIRSKTLQDKSIDFVLKWNRMGQEVPVRDELDDGLNWRFNSPFEEFALAMEMRDSRYESPGVIYTHKPLAIYVPVERKSLDRLGRITYRMLPILEMHREIELDMLRSYGVMYEWVKGVDAVQAAQEGILSMADTARLTLHADQQMRKKGFQVCDRKPHHVIVRPKKRGGLTKARNGQPLFALVDFELLQRTPEREESMKRRKLGRYAELKRARFALRATEYPTQLKPVTIMGVDYVHGNVESTKGKLWVVGRTPELFDYFLPERWEVTPRVRVTATREVYHTVTKDTVPVVWDVSRVGVYPDVDPLNENEQKLLAFGYNSPFEEVSLALYLRERGISTLCPMAVYMAGHRREMAPYLFHESRYISHCHLLNPDGTPLLRQDRSYITIWNGWNDVDEETDKEDEDFYERMSAQRAYRKRYVTKTEYVNLMQTIRERLKTVSVEDLNLRGSHFLVSLNDKGALIKHASGLPSVKLCSFELLRRL